MSMARVMGPGAAFAVRGAKVGAVFWEGVFMGAMGYLSAAGSEAILLATTRLNSFQLESSELNSDLNIVLVSLLLNSTITFSQIE